MYIYYSTIQYMISVHDGTWIFTLHAAVLTACNISQYDLLYTSCNIHTYASQTRALGTKIQRMFVSQRINICLIYLPLHRPSKCRYICNSINFTTPYNMSLNTWIKLHYYTFIFIYTQKKQQNRILVPTSHCIPTTSRRSTLSNTTEANRVTEAGRTKRLIERRPKKLATVWVAILGTCCWKMRRFHGW